MQILNYNTNQFCNNQGKRNPGTDQESVESFLSQVKNAKKMKVDR